MPTKRTRAPRTPTPTERKKAVAQPTQTAAPLVLPSQANGEPPAVAKAVPVNKVAAKAAKAVPVPTAKTGTSPVCSEDIEAWLNGQTPPVAFEPCRMIKLDQINESASRSNQARDIPVSTETVDRYAQMIRNGDKFPPMVVYRNGNKYVVIDGNNRLAAAKKENVTEWECYVLADDVTSEMIQLLTMGANARHGLPVSAEWRSHQANHLMNLGFSNDVVAKTLGMSSRGIKDAQKVERGRQHADALGLTKLWKEMSFTNRNLVANFSDDQIFANLLKLVVDLNMKTGLATFVTELRKSPNALELLVQKRKELEFNLNSTAASRAGKGARINNAKQRVYTTLGSLMAIRAEDMPMMFLRDAERIEISSRMSAALIHLLACEESLTTAIKASKQADSSTDG